MRANVGVQLIGGITFPCIRNADVRGRTCESAMQGTHDVTQAALVQNASSLPAVETLQTR